jgi:hypothetical protein
MNFYAIFSVILFVKIAAEGNRYVRKKNLVQHEPGVSKTSSFVSHGVP